MLAGALLGCAGAELDSVGGGAAPGGSGGTDAPGGSGAGGVGGTSGGGSGAAGGVGGTGGSGGVGGVGGVGSMPPVEDPNWTTCLSGPPRRPAGGTWLQAPDAPFRMPALQTDVPEYDIRLSPLDLAEIFAHVRQDLDKPATFEANGERHQVLVRLRGNSSRSWPKKSWRIELPEGTRFDGRRKINLISGWRDSTLMVEKLGYDLLAALGFPAPRAKYVRLTINGQYQGVYLDLERVDKDYLRNHGFADKDATIYRCGRKDCEMKLWRAEFQTPWEKKTNELDPKNDLLDRFLCAVNATPEPELVDVLEERVELELHLRNMVVDALIANDTVEDSRSYVAFDTFTGRMTYVPWDLNNSTTRLQPGNRPGKEGDFDHPLFLFTALDGWSDLEWQKRMQADPSHAWHPLSSNLNNRIVFHPALRARLVARTEQALAQVFKPEVLDPWIDQVHDLLRPYVVGDANVTLALFDDGPRYMKQYLRNRAGFLRAQLDKFRALPDDLLLESVDPASGVVTIRNRGAAPVSTATAVLSTDVRARPLLPNLPARVLQPGDSMEVRLAVGVPGMLALWANGQAAGLRDVLILGQIPAGTRYERDEAGNWLVR